VKIKNLITLFLVFSSFLCFGQGFKAQANDELLRKHHTQYEKVLNSYLSGEKDLAGALASAESDNQIKLPNDESAGQAKKLPVKALFFFRNNCGSCLKVEKDTLPAIKKKYQGQVNWVDLDVSQRRNLELMISIHSQYSEKEAVVPAFLIGGTYLSGRGAIEKNLDNVLAKELLKGNNFLKTASKVDLVAFFKDLSLMMIVSAGLLDGLNPCAFAVIVFFVSFLSVYGYSRREIVYVGSAYCAAVFVTYLLIGLGIFRSLYSLSHTYIFIKGFYYFTGLFCFSLAIFSLVDYIKIKKTGKTDSVTLQLPKFLKKRINLVIGSRLRAKNKRSAWELMFTAFSIGFLVSILEAVCTGQVYVPVIVSIIRYPGLKAKALFYLLTYNLMFILPLLFVFLLSFLGCSSLKFNSFLKKNIADIKLLMVLLFFLLGVFVIGSDYFHSLLSKFIVKFF